MRCLITLIMVLPCLQLMTACSDDGSSPPADSAVVDQPLNPPEASTDLPDPDQDAPLEQGVVDASDGAAGDQTLDLPLPPDGSASFAIKGKVTRSIAPLLDGKGTLHVGLYLGLLTVGTVQIPNAHFKTTATAISYGINAGPGTYTLSAFLDDNQNALWPFIVPDGADLLMTTGIPVTITAGKPLEQDLVLDKLGDSGSSGFKGGLKGSITSGVVPQLDGKGTIFITLHGQLPPADQKASTTIPNADLSSPFNKELYFLGDQTSGKYYLRVYLDDNGSSGPFKQVPDPGDLTHKNPVQVHVTGGKINIYDVVLDTVLK